MNIFLRIAFVLIGLFIVLNWGLIMSGIIRKIIARLGMRRGIKVYQPYINLIKNFSIRSQLTHGVMFYLGPVFRLSGGVGIFLFMPMIYVSEYWSNFSFTGDLILIAYFMFFGMLGMALGAGEGGHPYSAIGISRGLAQFTAIELPFTLAIFSIAIQYNTLSILDKYLRPVLYTIYNKHLDDALIKDLYKTLSSTNSSFLRLKELITSISLASRFTTSVKALTSKTGSISSLIPCKSSKIV